MTVYERFIVFSPLLNVATLYHMTAIFSTESGLFCGFRIPAALHAAGMLLPGRTTSCAGPYGL